MASAPASEIFRYNVRMIMASKNLTISAVAAAVGTSQSSLSNVLAGKEGVSFNRAERIAKHLGYELAAMIVEKFVEQPA